MCDDELRNQLDVSHIRSIIGSDGNITSGTVDVITTLADVFDERGEGKGKEAKGVWTDLANALRAVGEMARYLDLK